MWYAIMVLWLWKPLSSCVSRWRSQLYLTFYVPPIHCWGISWLEYKISKAIFCIVCCHNVTEWASRFSYVTSSSGERHSYNIELLCLLVMIMSADVISHLRYYLTAFTWLLITVVSAPLHHNCLSHHDTFVLKSMNLLRFIMCTYGVSKRSFQSIKYNIYFINLDWHWMFRNTFNYEINESKHFCKLTLNTKCNFGEC